MTPTPSHRDPIRNTSEGYIQSTTVLGNQMQLEQKMQDPFCLAEKEQ